MTVTLLLHSSNPFHEAYLLVKTLTVYFSWTTHLAIKGNGASYSLEKQSLQDAPACLQVHQENKIT